MVTLNLQLLPSYSLTTIAIGDISSYGNVTPTNVSMEVTVPGYSKTSVTFVPRVVNIYDSNSLNLICGSDGDPTYLPDGIYTFKYSVSPNATTWVEKSFMRTTLIKAKVERLFLSVDLQCGCGDEHKKKMKRLLQEIRLLIDGSVAAANQCDLKSAYDLYKKADKMIENVKPCNC